MLSHQVRRHQRRSHVVVDVDATAVAGSTIVNQAMVHGAFKAGAVDHRFGDRWP